MNQRLQVAIVTGAAGGIGAATVEGLARAGYHVAMVGRTESRLNHAARLMESRSVDPGRLLIIAADISEQRHAHRVVDEAMRRWKRVDVLVNNAAAFRTGPIAQVAPAALQETFATNVFGPMYLLARLWPVFLEQKRGCVINVSSMAGVNPFPGLSTYAASKCALESLTRSILNEAPAHSIRAFNVAPGAVETAMLRAFVPQDRLPRERTLDPAVVAQVIVDCAVGKRDKQVGETILLPSP